DAGLLIEPPASSCDRPFARARMAAAGVRPQSTRVILLPAALLQQQAAALIDQEDREGAVQQALAVDRILAGGADCAIALVDQDQLFISHARNHAFRAASFVALALSASTRLSRPTTK